MKTRIVLTPNTLTTAYFNAYFLYGSVKYSKCDQAHDQMYRLGLLAGHRAAMDLLHGSLEKYSPHSRPDLESIQRRMHDLTAREEAFRPGPFSKGLSFALGQSSVFLDALGATPSPDGIHADYPPKTRDELRP